MLGLGYQELIVLLVFPVGLASWIGGADWIYRHAARRGISDIGWLIAWLIGGLITLVVWLIVRPRGAARAADGTLSAHDRP